MHNWLKVGGKVENLLHFSQEVIESFANLPLELA